MKTLYFDCGMGAAGDMLAAALMDICGNKDEFIEQLNAVGIPGVTVSWEQSEKCGIVGTHFIVTVNGEEEGEGHHHEHVHHEEHHHEHCHSSLDEIEHIVSHLSLSETVKRNVLSVYGLIAEAESHVHGVEVKKIHFHEVGSMDALADITAVCMLMERLSPEKVIASPVNMGRGHVHCAHGILPVPAPATAYIMQGIPSYQNEIMSELCTPTGAALIKHFVNEFGNMPVMKTRAIGYGMGRKSFEIANCVRAFIGESGSGMDDVLCLNFNVDDMTAESIGYLMQILFDAGAREVFTVPCGMKKSRPGTLVSVIIDEKDRQEMLRLIFAHSTTIGIRELHCGRHVLDRHSVSIETELGTVHKKFSEGYGVCREKYEYEDIAVLAKKMGSSLKQAEAYVAECERKSKG